MLVRLAAVRGLPRMSRLSPKPFTKLHRPCTMFHREALITGRPVLKCHFSVLRVVKQEKKTEQVLPATTPPAGGFFSSGLGRLIKYSIVGAGVLAIVCAGALTTFFIYDSTTYRESDVPETLEVPVGALHPTLGGPENLPIYNEKLDSYDSEVREITSYKPKLVVLGSGWASVGLLKNLKNGDYDVTVISPQNYFLFTPLLPSAATGTLSVKSLMASIRKIVTSVSGHYLEARAEKIEFKDKLVKVSQVLPQNGESRSFYVPYDKLVIAVGSTANTHGVEGLEYCDRLKSAEDALDIKKKIKLNLELACLPTTSEEERKRLLSFVVCGGGPTGVEFAAEVFDLLNEDLPKLYPQILRQQVSVHIIQSRSHILNTYDEKISEYAMERFKKESIDLLINSRVERILPTKVIFKQVDPKTGESELKELPFGCCLWSTGVAQNPLAKHVVQSFQEHQRNRRAIETDSQLRIIGNPDKDVYAIGDCSTVRSDLAANTVQYMKNFITQRDIGHPNTSIITDDDVRNMTLTYDEIRELCRQVGKLHPQTRESFVDLEDFLPKYDLEKKGSLNYDQLTLLLKNTEAKVTSLPATAQRAHQQGTYLGKKLTKIARYTNDYLRAGQPVPADLDDNYCKPFKYVHLGSLAYIGNSAVFDLPGYSFVGGLIAMYLWRGVYFAQTVSLRTRVLLFMDWLKRGLFGRDIMTTS
ncbi:related to NADH-ubiquinone oxidoreductase 64 kDa subunit [Zygosaccharomyces bailii]|nr:related to NADH-ubiquinone oxidoreductase 64 kDa subunit [Zygosaccharomyces bailii]